MMFTFIFVCGVSASIQIGLITSKYTDSQVFADLSSNLGGVLLQVESDLSLSSKIELVWFKMDFDVESDESRWTIPKIFLDKSIQVMLDAANLVRYSNFLSVKCLESGLLHIVTSRPINTLEGEVPYKSTLFAETSYTEEAVAVIDIVQHFGWSNLGLIHDKDTNNGQMAEKIKKLMKSPLTVKDQVILDVDDTISTKDISYRLKSTTKDSGAKVIIVMSKATVAAQVLRAADLSVMGGVGYSWVLNSDAMTFIGSTLKNSHIQLADEDFGVLKSGAIGIRAVDALHQLEDSMSTYTAIITLICQGFLKISNLTGNNLRAFLLSNPKADSLTFPLQFDSAGMKKVAYKVYNIRNFAEIEIGSWDPDSRKVTIYEYSRIIWPGFSYSVPNDTISVIQLGLLYPGHTNDGVETEEGQDIVNGFQLAIDEVNQGKYLGNYQIQAIFMDTYFFKDLAVSNLKVLAPYNVIGFVGPHSLDLCQAYYTAQTAYEDQKPMISYSASSTSLSDANLYPNLLQIVQPDGLQAVALTLFIQLQGWDEIGVIYTNDEFGKGVYESFLANIGTLEVTITNSEDKRGMYFGLNEDGETIDSKTKDAVEEALSEIVRKQIKVIVYLGNPLASPEMAKVGNEKELKGKEYSWLGTIWLTENMMKYIEKHYKSHKSGIKNILDGAIGINYRKAQGDVGKLYSSNYQARFNKNYTTESMLSYDSVKTYASVIKGIIDRGDDYNSGKELINSLRSADLTGASGKIKFSEGSNGRSAYGYNVINYKNGKLVDVLEYDPLNPNLFTVINNETIVWGDGASSPPDATWPDYYDCPFAEHMSSTSPRGLGIIISIGTFLFILTLALSFYSYRKWKQLQITEIVSTVERSWKDTLVQVQIAIEFFQFIAIAPTFSSLEIVITAASNIFMLDVMKVASSNKGDYWILLTAVCILCYIWCLLVILIMCNGEHLLKKVPLCRRVISLLNSVFLPFFGNTFFLPALALLLDMFVCDHRAQGHDYVWRDCYTKCWEGEHKKYIIMSSIAIICYEPIAAYSRPLWQESRTGLNLKIKPFFLLLKTCYQILLIAIGKSLQSSSPMAHGVVYTILISIFTVCIYKIQPFNYNRCNLWELSSMIAVSYLSFLATLSYAKEPTHIAWFIALVVGWGIIGGVTMIIQKKYMPNLLAAPSGNRNKRKVQHDELDIKKLNQIGIDNDRPANPDVSRVVADDNEDDEDEEEKDADDSNFENDDVRINLNEANHKNEEEKVQEENDDVVRVLSLTNVQKFDS
jgi:ABC-type branched-subunit amino acid transport system substrate-binding protein